ncbi:hypothetical protein AMJ85_04815 [candidate division BRC1 bacterium SM23_51]|nr:MAG: hypothetical protein AMJ85_04815 [candidate division BRC1 bacterium SM23_51]
MKNVAWALIGLSALGFVGAVVLAVSSRGVLGVAAEGFSRACSNLALLAIALLLATGEKGSES